MNEAARFYWALFFFLSQEQMLSGYCVGKTKQTCISLLFVCLGFSVSFSFACVNAIIKHHHQSSYLILVCTLMI